MPTDNVFRKDCLTIDLDIEDAFVTGQKCEGFNDMLVIYKNVIRRTDGSF